MVLNECVFFWKPPSVFSQWTPSMFVVDGLEYCCAEQYMMSEKAKLFGDYKTFDQIMSTSNPKKHKELGRKVSNFNAKVWDDCALDIVIKGNTHKFQQNHGMRQKLQLTGNKTLVEASPFDNIWGIGMSRRNKDICDTSKWGQNKLGNALMKVRDIL